MPSCAKVAHATRAAALQHVKDLVWKNHTAGQAGRSKNLNVYPCDACGAWHVGHASVAPSIYHYTFGKKLDAILAAGALWPAPGRYHDRRGLPQADRLRLKILDEPEPLLWFSRNAVWDYSVMKGETDKKGRDRTLHYRSDLELAGEGLIRFAVPSWCAKLRWSDYLQRNRTPAWMRDSMAHYGDPREWLCTDEAVSLDVCRSIDVFYRGAWIPVDRMDEDHFDAYLAGRRDEYAAAAERVNARIAAGDLPSPDEALPDADVILWDDMAELERIEASK